MISLYCKIKLKKYLTKKSFAETKLFEISTFIEKIDVYNAFTNLVNFDF